MLEHLLETWQIHARICRYVLAAVDDEALSAPSLKGRSVGDQFIHLHAVRLMWLKAAQPELLEGLAAYDKNARQDKESIGSLLESSGEAVGRLIERGLTAGRIKGFKPHPTAFIGYLISHESFHQGDIGVRLSESGHPLPKSVSFGMWEWGVR